MPVLAPPSPDMLPDPSMPKWVGFKIPDLSEPAQPTLASPEGAWPMPDLKDQVNTQETGMLAPPVETIPQSNNIKDIGNVAAQGALPKWMKQRLLPSRTWADGTPRYPFIDSQVPLESFPGWQITNYTRKISRIPEYIRPETPISVIINKNKLKNEKPVKKQKPNTVHQETNTEILEPNDELLEPTPEPVEALQPELQDITIQPAKLPKKWTSLAAEKARTAVRHHGRRARQGVARTARVVTDSIADRRLRSLSTRAIKARSKTREEFKEAVVKSNTLPEKHRVYKESYDNIRHMLGTDAKRTVDRKIKRDERSVERKISRQLGKALRQNTRADMLETSAQGRAAEIAERRAKRVKVTPWAAPWPAPNPRTFVASGRPEAAAKAPQSADELRLETVLKLKDAGERKLVTELMFDHDDPDLIEYFLVVQAEHLSDEAKNILAHDRDQKIARHNLEAQNNIFG